MPRVQFNGNETPDVMPLPPVAVPVDFEVLSIDSEESKAGNPMLHATVAVHGEGLWDGDKVHSYFVGVAENKRTQIEFKHFAEACGQAVGEEGIETEVLLGCTGQLTFKSKTYQGKPGVEIDAWIKP